MNNLVTFASNKARFNNRIEMADTQKLNTLVSLRERALKLVNQTENEELLAEVIGVLSGQPVPCTYTQEQMEMALLEAEEDYQSGHIISHNSICEQYGI